MLTQIKHILQTENIDHFGICSADNHSHIQELYENWLKNGNHGHMTYLNDHSHAKTNPQKLLPNTKSIILIGINYYQQIPPNQSPCTMHQSPVTMHQSPCTSHHAPLSPKIAKYAWGRDYHKVIRSKLKKITTELQKSFPQAQFRHFTDATPLLERQYAQKAGLGYIGKNTMNISLESGSYFLIGEILTTLALPPTKAATKQKGICGTCRRCQDACPTGALDQAYKIDARKCISYLTIEHKGSIPEELRPKIGNWLFGCDICQDVCPHNIRAKVTTEPDFTKHISGPSPELAKILKLKTDEEFTEMFAGSPVMRAKRVGIIRNACIVAANTKAQNLLPQLKILAQDQNKIIAEHAKWAVTQLTT